jgi:predicted nucleic acid-binding protein
VSRIFWDSNIFIYLFELHPIWGAPIQGMRQRMLNRKDELVTSWVTVSEVQVQPYKLGRTDLCQLYKESIVRSARLLPFAEQAADAFVSIRALGVSSTDAIQLACASAAGTDLFVTNDKKLHGLKIPNINFITSVDRVPF